MVLRYFESRDNFNIFQKDGNYLNKFYIKLIWFQGVGIHEYIYI